MRITVCLSDNISFIISVGALCWFEWQLVFPWGCKRENRTYILKGECLPGEIIYQKVFIFSFERFGFWHTLCVNAWIITMFHHVYMCLCFCRCVRGQETCWCVMATVMEPFTRSVLACQWLPRENSSVVNATVVRAPCVWHRAEICCWLL